MKGHSGWRRGAMVVGCLAMLGTIAWFGLSQTGVHGSASMGWRIAAAMGFLVVPFYPLAASSWSILPTLEIVAPRSGRQFLGAVTWWATWWFLFGVVQGYRIWPQALIAGAVATVLVAMLAGVARSRATQQRHTG